MMDTSRRWALGSLVFAVVVSAGFLLVPSYETGCMGDAFGADGGCTDGVIRRTLVEENGPGVLWVLSVPVVLAAIGTLLRPRGARVAVAVTLGAFSLLLGFSIGGAYIPSVVAMAVAAAKSDPHMRARTTTPKSLVR